jgi:hypothetical protein
VEHVHNVIAFIHGVENFVYVRFLSEQKMAKLFVFEDDRATIGNRSKVLIALARRLNQANARCEAPAST